MATTAVLDRTAVAVNVKNCNIMISTLVRIKTVCWCDDIIYMWQQNETDGGRWMVSV